MVTDLILTAVGGWKGGGGAASCCKLYEQYTVIHVVTRQENTDSSVNINAARCTLMDHTEHQNRPAPSQLVLHCSFKSISFLHFFTTLKHGGIIESLTFLLLCLTQYLRADLGSVPEKRKFPSLLPRLCKASVQSRVTQARTT